MPPTLLALKQLLSKPVCRCRPKRINWWKDVAFNFIAFGLALCVFISGCNKSAVINLSEANALFDNHNPPNLALQTQNPHVLKNLRFEHISVEDGLAQNDAISIIQDREGFMWFGSEDGLNRYDGKNITVFKHDPERENSLCDNWIWDIYEDSSGVLWIGTLNGGLDRYDREINGFSHFRHDPENPHSLDSNEVLVIFEDSKENLWIGTRAGLNRFDRDTEIFIHYNVFPDTDKFSSKAIISMYESSDGTLWLGTDGGGLSEFNVGSEKFTHYLSNPAEIQSLGQENVWAVYEDLLGIIWAGTDAGLVRFDRASGTFRLLQNNPADPTSISHNFVRAIFGDGSGALWVGTDGGGLNRFDPATETFTRYQNDPGDPMSLSHYAVNDIYQDREGVLWIGTKGGGLNKLYLGGLNFAYFNFDPNDPNSLSDNNIRGIDEDESGILWIGTNAGLNRFDRLTGQWQHFQHDADDPFSISSNVIGDVLVDRGGSVWVGTFENGLNRFDPATKRFIRYQEDPENQGSFKGSTVTEIFQDQQGGIWFGTLEGGINKYDEENDQFIHYLNDKDDPTSINSNAIVSIFEDHQGVLWIGTFSDGLNKYDRETETFVHYRADSKNVGSLSHNFVLAIHEDREETLWVGTAGGLNKFDPQAETFQHFRETDGLPSDLIYGILEDGQKNLWLSTNHGLARVNPQTETIMHFDVHDGLQSNEFNSFAYHKSKNGELFFGGISGLNAFYPDQIQDINPYIPPVVMTSLSQSGEKMDLEQNVNDISKVTLRWPDNFFEFEFAALSFVQSDENQYAYKLDGFDDSWNYTGNQGFGRYTNLPGGSYTLQLSGSNNDGVWNETGHALSIKIVPPIWQNWGFRVSLAFLLVAGAFIGYRQRIKSVESRSRDLEIQVEERTAELQREIEQRTQIEEALRNSETEKAVAAERSRLARELHDSVTQSLYSLTLFTEAARHIAEEDENEIIERYVGQIGVIGLQALKEMRLLVFELRPAELEKEGLVSALRRRLEAVEGRAGVDARVVVDELFKLPRTVEQEFFRIAQEALNNALKHAAAASVVVQLRRDHGRIKMEVIDDGVGFDPQSLPDRGGMGLKSILERAERLNGDVTIYSNPGEGTNIKVTIKDFDDAQEPGEKNE